MSLQLLWLQNYGFWTSSTRASRWDRDVHTLPHRQQSPEPRPYIYSPKVAAQNASPRWENTMAVKDGKACKIHQTGSQTSLLDPTAKLWIVAKLSQNTSARWGNTMAVKDGKACKTHQTGGLTSLLDLTAKLWITAQAAARTHLPNGKCS